MRSNGVAVRRRGQIIRVRLAHNRYPMVTLGKGRHVTVHGVVAEAFLGPRPGGLEVRHLNGDRTDCHAANLAYGTRRQNRLDTVAHGTHHYGKRDHCKHGHAFTPENTRLRDRGNTVERICIACTADRNARNNALRKARQSHGQLPRI